MKSAALIAIWLFTLFPISAQHGYVKLRNDSVLTGYVKYALTSAGERGIEVWQDRHDKHPAKLRMAQVYEYSIKPGDTIRVLLDFKPYVNHSVYYDLIEVNLLARAKLVLMESSDTFMGNPMFILENPVSGAMNGVPAGREFFSTLMDFLPEKFLKYYVELYGDKVAYGDVPQMVRLFNRDVLVDSLSAERLNLRWISLNQIARLIEQADQFVGKTERDLLSMEPSVLGGWKLRTELESPESGRNIFFEGIWGPAIFNISNETGLVDFMMIGCRKPVTKKELAKFLKGRYQGKSFIIDRDSKARIEFDLVESKGIYFVLVIAFPTADSGR